MQTPQGWARKTKKLDLEPFTARGERIKFALGEIEIRPSMSRYGGRLIMPSIRIGRILKVTARQFE